eukprot:COSAG02_NODE_2629_length_8393_cov_3321.102725_2_plen_154_part_00
MLAKPQVWQHADLEEGKHFTPGMLRFTIPQKEPYEVRMPDGLLFRSRFFFHSPEDTLDTLAQPTHWGTFFVPFNLPDMAQYNGPLIVEVRTEYEEEGAPSRFELRMRLGQLDWSTENSTSKDVKQDTDNIRWSEWVCDEASRCSGLPSHEYFM